MLTSPVFDPYLRDILVPLVSGAKIYLTDRRILMLPRIFGETLRKCEITFLHTTPSILNALMSYTFGTNQFESLRYILIAGEPLQVGLVARWYKHYGKNTILVNLYGPTETTLAKVYSRIGSDFSDEIVPVGRPITDSEIYIVKDDGETEQAHGKMGEVCIGTNYMSHGYYNDHTNPSFKYCSNRNIKLYLTGDLGYVRNGNLFLVGRKDDKKKIGGIMIRLNDIKKAVLQYQEEQIMDCAILYENNLLSCFYTSKSALPDNKMREFLADYLRPVHIPHKFNKIETLPITLNGKIDKNELRKLLL